MSIAALHDAFTFGRPESARASLTRSYTQVLAPGKVEQEMSSFTDLNEEARAASPRK
ncbi:MAG: hypothetical protein QOC96_2666 [Acidobacteriota bacterium]|jgi:hypothetical protein|nr:hypothetical protein [Acidobacteriota bacterium]